MWFQEGVWVFSKNNGTPKWMVLKILYPAPPPPPRKASPEYDPFKDASTTPVDELAQETHDLEVPDTLLAFFRNGFICSIFW